MMVYRGGLAKRAEEHREEGTHGHPDSAAGLGYNVDGLPGARGKRDEVRDKSNHKT